MSVAFQWRKNRMKCDMAVQTEVALQNSRYVSDLGTHMKVAWAWFEKNRICAVQTDIRKLDMGHIWAKKSDLGHFSLQCELSLYRLLPAAANLEHNQHPVCQDLVSLSRFALRVCVANPGCPFYNECKQTSLLKLHHSANKQLNPPNIPE